MITVYLFIIYPCKVTETYSKFTVGGMEQYCVLPLYFLYHQHTSCPGYIFIPQLCMYTSYLIFW